MFGSLRLQVGVEGKSSRITIAPTPKPQEITDHCNPFQTFKKIITTEKPLPNDTESTSWMKEIDQCEMLNLRIKSIRNKRLIG